MSVTILVGVATVAILAAVCCLLRASRRPREAAFHYFRCPDCGQKMRYAASRAGRDAICPRCRRRWTLPATPQPLASPEAVPAVGRGRGGALALRRTVQA
jgi:hypothetical protein